MGSDTSKSKKRATQLTEDEIQLLLKNTHFNRQQIKEWHQGFLVSNQLTYSSKILVQEKQKQNSFLSTLFTYTQI
jgi:hypothetical protein